jgi:hypothetical protein
MQFAGPKRWQKSLHSTVLRVAICLRTRAKTITPVWNNLAGVAEEVLNKCTASDPDIKNLDDERYSVVYNYEFMEDTRNEVYSR